MTLRLVPSSMYFASPLTLTILSGSLWLYVTAISIGFATSDSATAGTVMATRGNTWYCINAVHSPPSTPNCSGLTGANSVASVPTSAINQDILQYAVGFSGGCPYSMPPHQFQSYAYTVGSLIGSSSIVSARDLYLVEGTSPTCSTFRIAGEVDQFTEWHCAPPYTVGNPPTAPTCSGGLGILFFDPVADGLVSGAGLVSNTALLAAATHAVNGATADSATVVLIQIVTPNAGDQVQLTLSDENGPSTDGNGAGYLTDTAGAGKDSRYSGGVITLNSVFINPSTSLAFAAFHVPTDFIRAGNSSDAQKMIRQLTITASDTSAQISNTESMGMVRPPVVFVHGLWGSKSDFQRTGLLNTLSNAGVFDATTSFTFAEFNNKVLVPSSSPSYGSLVVKTEGAAFGFVYGAGVVLPQIKKAVTHYKTANPLHANIASTQADLVVHSMGGDVARALPQMVGFIDSNTYGKGYLHKLVTIDTPHSGSPLANALLNPLNACVRGFLAAADLYSFSTAVVNGNTFNGAVGDLATGSVALGDIHSGNGNIPTAMVGGQLTLTQQNSPGTGAARLLKTICSGSPLAQSLTPTAWPTLMHDPMGFLPGGASDGIVPLTSQYDNDPSYYSANTSNSGQGIHSVGTKELGFPNPTVFDQASGIPSIVLALLNTPVSNGTIYKLKP